MIFLKKVLIIKTVLSSPLRLQGNMHSHRVLKIVDNRVVLLTEENEEGENRFAMENKQRRQKKENQYGELQFIST